MKCKKSEMEKVINEIEKFRKFFVCVNCNKKLDNKEKYQIKDAWENDKEEAFLYIECDKCGYGNALWKIIRHIKGAKNV